MFHMAKRTYITMISALLMAAEFGTHVIGPTHDHAGVFVLLV